MAILTEEVGELARHFARQYGDQSYRDSEIHPHTVETGRELIADEMADLLWVLICLANQTGVDLNDAFLNCSAGIGSTYVGKVPAGRIDYIFHSTELISSNFKIQTQHFSDHRAIQCVISKVNKP